MQQLPDDIMQFKVERYKYILQEMRSLNENIHKYLALFETLATFVIGGGVSVFLGWKSLHLSSEVAIAAINGLLVLLLLLALFVVASIVTSISLGSIIEMRRWI